MEEREDDMDSGIIWIHRGFSGMLPDNITRFFEVPYTLPLVS